MKNTFFIIFILAVNTINSQIKLADSVYCDTVISRDGYVYHKMDNHIDTENDDTLITCYKKNKLGFRVDFGLAGYKYNDKTAAWLGNHLGLLFGFYVVYDKFNLGFKFKPWTVSPSKDLVFGNDTLRNDAKLNPIKLDLTIGYSIDFKYNFSLEPYAGLNRTVFLVINEKDLGKMYDLKTSYGLTVGITLNKYFSFKDYQYVSIFSNIGYSFTDFKRTHEQLGVGYLDWSIGIGFKFYTKKETIKKINNPY
jgi:hypothetical protein